MKLDLRPPSAHAILLFLFVLTIWLSHVDPPGRVPGPGLDEGWLAAMTHFLATGSRAGTDWIFTSGPLAGISSPIYRAETYWWKLFGWEGAWRLCTSIVIALATLRVRGGFERLLCAAFVVVATIYFDAWALVTLVSAAVLLEDTERPPSPIVDWIVLVAFAGMGFAKFTMLVAAIGLIAALSVARSTRRGHRAGIVLALKALLVLSVTWFATGQGLSDLWPYLTTTWQIASTYSEAQSTPVLEPIRRVLGLLCVAAFGLLLALWTFAGGVTRAKAAVALGLAFVVFCGWKTGFVRAGDHPTFFFSFAPAAALLLPAPRYANVYGALGVRLLRLTAFVLGCVGISHTDLRKADVPALVREGLRAPARASRALIAFAQPVELRNELENELDLRQTQHAIPLTIARVGDDTIDFYGYHQGLLLLHELNWTPRPAFQSYITFTRDLQQRNASFLEGPRAPKFLLSRFETIDGRWAAMDDALALEVVSRDYRPVENEAGYLLLERRADAPRQLIREVVHETELRFGEGLKLPRANPEDAQFVTLEIRSSLAGSLARMLDSTPALTMRVVHEDGKVRRGRIVPVTMRSRVMVDPLVETSDDFVSWMLGHDLKRCVGLTIECGANERWRFATTFKARIERTRALKPDYLSSLETPEWARQAMRSKPDILFVARTPSSKLVDGRPVAVVQAPSRLVWKLAPGQYRLRLRYGLLPEQARLNGTQPGQFVVLDLIPGDVRVHLREAFSADSDLAQRGMQTLDTTFGRSKPFELVLATLLGTDWAGIGTKRVDTGCYWTDIQIDRIGDAEEQ